MQIIESSDEFHKVDKEITAIPNKTHPITVEHTDGNKIVPMQYYTLVKKQLQPTTANYTYKNLQALHNASKLIVTSDGSHDPISGDASYAWVITTKRQN